MVLGTKQGSIAVGQPRFFANAGDRGTAFHGSGASGTMTNMPETGDIVVKRAAGCSNCENSTPRWHYSELLSDHYRHARSHRLRFSGVRDIAARASGRRGPKIGVSPRPGDLKTIRDLRTLVCGSVDDCAASRLAGGAHTAANRLAKSLSRPSPRTSSGRSCAAVGRREPHRSTRTNPQPESES